MRKFRMNVVGRTWQQRVVLSSLLAISFVACTSGCSNAPSNDAAGTTAQPASTTKPVIVAMPSASAMPTGSVKPVVTSPKTDAAAPAATAVVAGPKSAPYAATKDVFSVALGAGRTTLNEQPIASADLPKAFEVAWNDYIALCKTNKLVPILNLQVSETEPVEVALQLLTHVGRAKGAKVQLRGTEQFNDAAAATPERRPISFQFRPESTGPATTQSEMISLTSKVDSKGKLWKTYVSATSLGFQPEQLTESGFKGLREYLALKMNQATLAGHDVPDVSWTIDGPMRGQDFLRTAFSLAWVLSEGKSEPNKGYFYLRSAAEVNSEVITEKNKLIIGPSSNTLNPGSSIVDPAKRPK